MVRPEGATEYRMNFASVVAQNESVQLRSATIGPYFRVVSRFDLAPLQGASLRGGRFPGLKPWAESCSPFGFGAKAMRDALPTAPTTRKYWDRTLNRYMYLFSVFSSSFSCSFSCSLSISPHWSEGTLLIPSSPSFLLSQRAFYRQRSKIDNEHDNEHEHDQGEEPDDWDWDIVRLT